MKNDWQKSIERTGIFQNELQIKLLIETKPIVCLPWEILHYKISREKLKPEPGFETRTSGFLARRSAT